jgi:hypothetical protein
VDGLAYPLHHPTACNHQTRGHGVLSSAALSHHAAVGGDTFSRDAKPPSLIFVGVLTVWVLVLSNLTWSKLFLPGLAYSMSEPS